MWCVVPLELSTYLHDLQLLQSLLNQFLYLPRIRDSLVLMKGVSRSPARIHSEVVVGELVSLPQQRSIQGAHAISGSIGGRAGQSNGGHGVPQSGDWGPESGDGMGRGELAGKNTREALSMCTKV